MMTDLNRSVTLRLDETIRDYHAKIASAQAIAKPLVAASVESLAEMYPNLPFGVEFSSSGFMENWPLFNDKSFSESLQRGTALRRTDVKLLGVGQVPTPLFSSKRLRLVDAGAQYGQLDKTDQYLPAENIPSVATRLTQDLATWAGGMMRRGHDLLVGVDFDGDPAISVYANTPQVRSYQAWLTNEPDTLIEVPRPDHAVLDLRISPSLIAGASDEGIRAALAELAA